MTATATRFFNFPTLVQEAFTLGDCWHLAETIHTMTGHPIITASWTETVTEHDPITDEEEVWTYTSWSHVAVRLPDGRILDILGIWSEQEWLDHWAEQSKVYFYDPEEQSIFIKEWAPAEWLVERQECSLTPSFSEAAHAPNYAKEMLSRIN